MQRISSFITRSGPRTILVLCALSLLFMSLPVLGQERFGNISGSVTDSSGAVLPGVAVTMTNKTSGRVFTTASRDNGNFAGSDLEPGRYQVMFEKAGFSRYESPDVLVLVGRTARIEAQMQVGTLEQTVQVTESAALVDLSSTTIAHNVTAEEFDRLPKARNFQALALTSTSVNTGEIEGGFQINGASAAENNYYIDGVSTNSLVDGRARQNAVFEYIQEVQVKTAGLEAEYGGALGGVVSAVTKSGGNKFHGEGHYYFGGNKLSASPVKRLQLSGEDETSVAYFQDEKQKRDSHELGATISGPILKDHVWFLSSISPRWRRDSSFYHMVDGDDTLDRKSLAQNWFNKLSFEPSHRVRANLTWLWTPTRSTGTMPAYDGFAPNTSSLSVASNDARRVRGYSQPETSYTGNVDITLTSTSLLSVKAGRYYLDFKDTGVPTATTVWWRTTSQGMDIPADLQKDFNFSTPSAAQVLYDITTRTYGQVDFSQFVNFGGTHNIKAGFGVQKNVNRVDDNSFGPNGRVSLYWDTALSTTGDRGQYGYYIVEEGGTVGSTGANIFHMYIQDSWRVTSRLTLNLGLRAENETIPSFQRDIKDYAIKFGFGDKISPRFGASYDVLGNGKLKAFGSWGRYFDWTKYDLARGTFGGDVWHQYYRSLDTLDVFGLNLQNMPGRNLWTSVYRNRRVPGFDYLDPDVKPMSSDLMNIGMEYEVRPQMVFSARYTRNKLNRTIEDMGALDAAGDEVYRYGNPGEGANIIAPVSGGTCTVRTESGVCGYLMPKAKRIYDAMELSLSRRFSGGWLANVSYVYSKLWGNYSGLQSTDEIRPSSLGYGFGPAQQLGVDSYRSGGNANRNFDLDEAMWDSHGNVGLYGRLPTDRPHVVKFFGSKLFKFGTEVGGFFRVQSGTPVTTQVNSTNGIPVYVNGRGDLGRTPVFSQTDLMVAHEVKLGETKRLRFQFDAFNLFNQKTSQFTFDRLNREEQYDSVGIDLSGTDLSQGFDYVSMLNALGAAAYDPRFGMEDAFNPGFSGRFMVKFIF